VTRSGRARAKRCISAGKAAPSQWLSVAKTMTGSSEFTTWVALAGAAIVAGLCAIYSSSPWVLIPAALIGAYLGYKGEQLGRRYLQQYLAHKRSQ
jgi:hypothetical protein